MEQHKPSVTQSEDQSLAEFLPPGYRFVGKIGEGQTGFVVKAIQIATERVVAVKVLHEILKFDETKRVRMRREAKIMAGLDHPNLVKILSFGLGEGNPPFIVSEFVDGKNLSELLIEEKVLPAERCVSIMLQVLCGLESAHLHGIVHRDLKPANIIVGRDSGGKEVVKIVDFGIATQGDDYQRLTGCGTLLGSPAYMSPEQCVGASADARADLYSLGCVIYQCLTGAPPFVAESSLELMNQHLNQSPPPISSQYELPPFLERVVHKCLEKEKNNRPASACEIITELSGHDDTLSRYVRASSRRKVPRRRLTMVALCMLLAVSTGAVFVQNKSAFRSSEIPGTGSFATGRLLPPAPVLLRNFYDDSFKLPSEWERRRADGSIDTTFNAEVVKKLSADLKQLERIVDCDRKPPDALLAQAYAVKASILFHSRQLHLSYSDEDIINACNKSIVFSTFKDGTQCISVVFCYYVLGMLATGNSDTCAGTSYYEKARRAERYAKPAVDCGFDPLLGTNNFAYGDAWLSIALGECAFVRGKWGEAAKYFTRFIPPDLRQMQEPQLACCSKLLEAYEANHQHAKALAFATRLENAASSPSGDKERIYQLLASYYARHGYYNEAVLRSKLFVASLDTNAGRRGYWLGDLQGSLMKMQDEANARGNKQVVSECKLLLTQLRKLK